MSSSFVLLIIISIEASSLFLCLSKLTTILLPITSNDLPAPNSSNEIDLELVESDNPVISSILNQTNAINANPNIIDQIDNKSGYETDETIFDRLFKVKKE